MGTCHNKLYDSLATNIARTCRGVGDSGMAYQVGTLFDGVDDLHARGILQVVYMRDFPVTWSANLYSIESGSQIYNLFFGEFSASHGNTVDDKQCFSPLNGQSVKENHLDFRGHATGKCPGF